MNSARMPEHSHTRGKGDFPRDFHGHTKVGTSSFPPCFLSFQAEAPHRPAPYNVRNANATFGELKKPASLFRAIGRARRGKSFSYPYLFLGKETGTFFFCYCFCCGHRSRIFRRRKENNGRISWCLWAKKSLGIQGKTCVRKKRFANSCEGNTWPFFQPSFTSTCDEQMHRHENATPIGETVA